MTNLMLTPWTGGPSPVKNQETVVEIQYRDGFLLECRGWANDDLWKHSEIDPDNDIVGYNVVTPWTERVQ